MSDVFTESSVTAASIARSILCLVGFVGALSMPAQVFAQAPDARAKAEAQKLYEDGARDMEVDAYSRACPKFEAAFKILPDHIRTGVTLAECLDKLGKPANALSVLETVALLAKARGDANKLAEVEASIADVDKRAPKLTIRVPAAVATTPGFALSRNGVPIPRAAWETPVPLDPGEYELEASAVDKPTWKTTVRLSIGKAQTVEVTPGWEKAKIVVVAPPPAWPNRVRMAGIVGIGLGAFGLGTWGVLGGLAISKNNASKPHCSPDNDCDEEGYNRRNEAIGLGHGATVGLIAGGVFLATGVSLLVVAAVGKKETKRDAAWTVRDVSFGPSGVGVRGVW